MSTTSVKPIRRTCHQRTSTSSARPANGEKPIKTVRRFLSQLTLPPGTRFAILTTEIAPRPDKRTGLIPTEEEQAKWQRVRPIMNELLHDAGLTKVAGDKILVSEIKGPLEQGWETKVKGFVHHVLNDTTVIKQ